MIFWDSRVLKLLAKEEGQFTVSRRFKFIVEDCTWVFTGFMVPLSMGLGNFSGTNWELLKGYEMICGALARTSTSLDFQMNGVGKVESRVQ